MTKIVIDAGHGGTDPGAVQATPAGCIFIILKRR